MVEKPKRTRYSLTLTQSFVDGLNELVARGLYVESQDAMRRAIQDLFEKHGIEAFKDKREPKIIEREYD